MPIILLLILFPRLSILSTVIGFTFNKTSWSSLKTIKSIYSEVDIVINLETSKILFTLLLSIEAIISFFWTPATWAGLSFWTSSITAGVKSLPEKVYIEKNINIAKIKFAIGPAATINALWYKGFKINNFFCSSLLYFFNTSIWSLWLKTFLSPKNFTYPPRGIQQIFQRVPDLSFQPNISLPKPIEKSVTPTPYFFA